MLSEDELVVKTGWSFESQRKAVCAELFYHWKTYLDDSNTIQIREGSQQRTVNLLARRLPFGGGEVEGILYDTEGLHLVYLLKCRDILSARVKIIPYRLEITCLRTALR